MKSIKIFSVCLAALLGLSSCASSWLDQELTGSTLTQEEYNSMTNVAVGTVKGIYAYLYVSSDHDQFGQKSIDIATDLVSSDLAMTAQAYGWFTTDAQRITSGRTGYIWSLYFGMVMNANAVLRSLDSKSSMTAEETSAYAQALAIRAFCYYNIANLYGPAAMDMSTPSIYGKKGVGPEYDIAPYYTQADTTPAGLVKEKPLMRYDSLRYYIDLDLEKAIQLFDATNFDRGSLKLFINGDVARGIQAYNCLQMAWAFDEATAKKYYQKGLNRAEEVIKSGNYEMIPYENLLTTGFVDYSDPSWMWGLDVTSENYTALASFWGHIDIHTYSYAYAGAYKACDDNLYAQIPTYDKRRDWFCTNKTYGLVPDWKFYDKNRGETAETIDRNWKNDIVYMRIEEMYLIAAECAVNLEDLSTAREYLGDLLEERWNDNLDAVDTWGKDDLIRQIYYNWRVELFAEGRGLITFKRFNQYDPSDVKTKKRGTNHFALKGQDLTSTDYQMLYIVPSSEVVYNNQIAD